MRTPNRDNPWAIAKAAQRDARRETILRAATQCINRLGYTGASMAIIARELGLSYNALYHYFDSKEEILAQAFMRTHDLIATCVDRNIDASADGLARLLAFVDAFQQLVRDEALPSVALVGHLPQQTVNRLIARRNELLQSLRTIVEGGIDDGSIRSCDPTLLVHFVFGALENLPYWEYRPETVAASFQATVRHALAAAARP